MTIRKTKRTEAKMKRIFRLFFLAFVCAVLTECVRIGKLQKNDADKGNKIKETTVESRSEPASEKENDKDTDYELLPIRMFMADGRLYYDTGEASQQVPRCGTLDGIFKSYCDKYELPGKNAQANFRVERDDFNGWQNASENTKEVLIDGEWIVFKRADLHGNDISEFAGCALIKNESEHIILTVKEIELSDDGQPVYTESDGLDKDFEIPIKYGQVYNWGVEMAARNVTPCGMTLVIKQSGGNLEGTLSTGSFYTLDTWNGKFWEKVPYNTSYENIGWDSVMYFIPEDDTYSEDINWKWLYGELSEGRYRISKELMDFKAGTTHDEHTYYLEFEIAEDNKNEKEPFTSGDNDDDDDNIYSNKKCSESAVKESRDQSVHTDIHVDVDNVCPYALMHEDMIYYYTGEVIRKDITINTSDIIGTVSSTVSENKMPSENGQANLDIMGSPYIKHKFAGDGLLVLIDGEWILFETRDQNNTGFSLI